MNIDRGTAVIAAGGWAHPGADLISAATSVVEARGFAVTVATDIDALSRALDGPCDLLVMGSCWFSMTDERYTPEQRQEHAVLPSADLLEKLNRLRTAGCPLLALHTAVICFDGVADWHSWLGGRWNWQTSFHPPPERMEVSPVGNEMLSFDAFAVVDELYQGLEVDDGVTVIATSDDGHPLVWLRHTDTERVAVSLLGHDARSLATPEHEQLNGMLVDWLLASPSGH